MSSVTNRIKEIKQPRGGYIKPSQFTENIYDDGKVLGEENVHASIIGLAVDYLTRFLSGVDITEAFRISIKGYQIKMRLSGKDTLNKEQKKGIEIESLIKNIKGLDDSSIICACKAATYDVWLRNPAGAMRANGAEDINPDKQTIENIRIMVERSLLFWQTYGPVTIEGFTFEQDGYTHTVDSGDGDYLTADTMWDFKVSKTKPKSTHTLQLLMYWIMGQHSGKEEFKNITTLGMFNPRLNTVYRLNISEVPAEVIKIVEDEVICY